MHPKDSGFDVGTWVQIRENVHVPLLGGQCASIVGFDEISSGKSYLCSMHLALTIEGQRKQVSLHHSWLTRLAPDAEARLAHALDPTNTKAHSQMKAHMAECQRWQGLLDAAMAMAGLPNSVTKRVWIANSITTLLDQLPPGRRATLTAEARAEAQRCYGGLVGAARALAAEESLIVD